MDYHLAIFITVMLARRLVWTIVSEVNSLLSKKYNLSRNVTAGLKEQMIRLCCAGVSEQWGIIAPLRGTDRSPAQFADPVRLGALLDAGQPVQEPLCAEPSLPGIPVSLWHRSSVEI